MTQHLQLCRLFVSVSELCPTSCTCLSYVSPERNSWSRIYSCMIPCTQEMSDLPSPVSMWIMQCLCAPSCILPSLLCRTSTANLGMNFQSPESLPAEFLGIRFCYISGLLNLHMSELKTLSFQQQI